MGLYESIKNNIVNEPRKIKKLNESCKKPVKECNKRKINESYLCKFLGVKQNLTEKVNPDNVELNKIIGEVLRSKSAARKNEDLLKQNGITIDYSPREGVVLTGPNGRKLSADRTRVYGPSQPGHNRTHDTGRWDDINGYKKDIKGYKKYIDDENKEKEELQNMSRDDIIRKYPKNTTEEALVHHEKDMEDVDRRLTSNKRNIKWKEEQIRNARDRRELGHNNTIDYPEMDKTRADRKVDYKGYLDSKDNSENKDYVGAGWRRKTKGQRVRADLENLKSRTNDTYWSASSAQRDLEDKAIDAKAIEQRKKELEDEYKQRMDNEVNSMLKRKSDADASYAKHKEEYGENIKNLNDFRAKHNLKAKDDPDFDTYINQRAQDRY